MKKFIAFLVAAVLLSTAVSLGETAGTFASDPNDDPVGSKTAAYFNALFEQMGEVAAKLPNVETFRDAMEPLAENTEGFYGGTLLDSNWVIVQVYNPSHFLARGYDLHKVKELAAFIEKMKAEPSPQLSEPGHGSLVQPRLIAMRYPIVRDGRMAGMVSMMVKTDAFLEAVGLDRCKAWRITCLGQTAEEKGRLSASPSRVKVTLPATEWVIEYDPK